MEKLAKALFAEFIQDDTPHKTVERWRNNLKGGNYEIQCLEHLADFCVEYETTPDKLIKDRLVELQSVDLIVRNKAEDMLMRYYKKVVKVKSGKAINAYRKICSFYRYNFVRLQTKDPGYTVQRERDYKASKKETRKMCEHLDLEGKAYLLTLAECCGRPGAGQNKMERH